MFYCLKLLIPNSIIKLTLPFSFSRQFTSRLDNFPTFVSSANTTFFLALWVMVKLRRIRLAGMAFLRQERDGKRLMGMVAIRDVLGIYCCRLLELIVRNNRLVVEF